MRKLEPDKVGAGTYGRPVDKLILFREVIKRIPLTTYPVSAMSSTCLGLRSTAKLSVPPRRTTMTTCGGGASKIG